MTTTDVTIRWSKEHDGGDRIAWVGSYMIVGYLDAPAFFVYMKRGGGHVRIGDMVDTVDDALTLIANNEAAGA